MEIKLRIGIKESYLGIINRWKGTVFMFILCPIPGIYLFHLLEEITTELNVTTIGEWLSSIWLILSKITTLEWITLLILSVLTLMLMIKADLKQKRHRLNYQLEILKVLTDINVEILEKLSGKGDRKDYLNLYSQSLACSAISCQLIYKHGCIMNINDVEKMLNSLTQCEEIISEISPHLGEDIITLNTVMIECKDEIMALINVIENKERNN